jgi:hypothetical protein
LIIVLFRCNSRAKRLEAHTFPKLLAKVLWENYLEAFAGHWHAICASWLFFTALNTRVVRVTRDPHGCMELASTLIEGISGDLATRVDVIAEEQIQWGRARLHQCVEVSHHAVLPEESATATQRCINARPTHDSAVGVDSECQTCGVSGQSTEVLHAAVFSP